MRRAPTRAAQGVSLGAGLLAAIALGALLRLPYLDSEFRRDDHVMLAILGGGFAIERAPFDLYWFSGRDAAENAALRASGYLPWWSAPDYRIAFLRPLTSASIALDHALFGDDPRGFQLHSFAWWALLLGAVALVLGRALPRAPAIVALLLFALDESHAGPLGWPSNRGALVSGSLGLLALWAHLRARQDGDRAAAWLAPALIAASLLGGEYAMAALAYLVAYELFGARDAWQRRLRALAPVLALSAAYLVARAALGYGSRASGLYVDIAEDPGRYLASVLGRAPALAADALLGVPAVWFGQGPPLRGELLRLQLFDAASWQALPSWQSVQIAIGVVALAASGVLYRWLARVAGEDARALRWLLPGSLLALFASGGALPSARLLETAELGVAALFALSLVVGLARARELHGGRRARCLLGLCAIALLHGALPAQRSASHARDYRVRADAARRWALSAELPDDHAIGASDVAVLYAADLMTATYVPYVRARAGHPLPRSYRLLSGSRYPHRLRRIDAHTIELSVLSSALEGAFAGSLQRPATRPLRAGERIAVPGLEVEVVEARNGHPSRLRYRFERALDDPRLVLLSAQPTGLRRQPIPPTGESLILPFPALPWPPEASTFL